MALSDPFESTYRGSFEAGQSLGRGLGQAASAIGSKIEQVNQGKATQNMLKQFGILTEKEKPYSIDEIKDIAQKKFGTEININSTMPEKEQVDTAMKLLDSMGIKLPKRTTPDIDLDRAAKMGLSYKPDMFGGTAEIKPSPKTEYDKYLMQQRQQAHTDKLSQEQDKLESQAMQRVVSVRGDSPMANLENQRNSTILAYRTLSDAEKEGRLPTQFEYTDLLGQIWKARTGAAPTEEVMKSLNTPNIEQNMRKLYTNLTGDPSSGMSTEKIVSALKSFLKNTGEELDTQHQSYFDTHTIKPTGLDEERWKNIKSAQRGLKFTDEAARLDARESKSKTLTDKMGLGGKVQSGFKAGDIREKDGKKYQRNENGQWLPL